MGIIIDVILIAVLALCILFGYKKGLVNVIFNLCAVLVAIIVTFILYKPVSTLVIENTELDETIKQTILEKGITKPEETTIENGSGIDKYIEKYAQDTITNAKNSAVESVADTITNNAVHIIVAIGLFIVTRILLILLKVFAEALAELPIIKQFDKLGGVLYGVIVGFIIIYIVLAIVFFIVSINGLEPITEAIDSSYITKYLYGNNLILNIFF